MTALRELAERWKRHADHGGAVEYLQCCNELLSILDAEGDGGVVGGGDLFYVINQLREYGHVSDEEGELADRLHELYESITNPSTRTDHMDKRKVDDRTVYQMLWDEMPQWRRDALGMSKRPDTNPQPVRSGGVSDEDVRCAAVAYSRRATDGSQDVNFHDCIRAALEHFAKSQGESNV
jgi:hypothetical protein